MTFDSHSLFLRLSLQRVIDGPEEQRLSNRPRLDTAQELMLIAARHLWLDVNQRVLRATLRPVKSIARLN